MLTKKLHLEPGMRFAIVDAPDGFSRTLGRPPAGAVAEKTLTRELDLVLLFARDQKGLKAQWRKAVAALKRDGALWVSYPKKSSGIETDLGMGEWEAARGSDWSPVAMIGIDDTWSAVRFKHAPGLDRAREQRQRESVRDADGTVCIDRRNRIVTPPADLEKLLARNARARAFFDTLSFTNRREYVGWVIEARRPATRAARLEKAIDLLSAGKKTPAA
ncbi:MAG TPA: YdeI/OmpD-associated family protein [Vicinamibacterales bacterium]|jgi:hypothetical protein